MIYKKFILLSFLLLASGLFSSEKGDWEVWTDAQIREDFAPYEERGIFLEDLEQTMLWDFIEKVGACETSQEEGGEEAEEPELLPRTLPYTKSGWGAVRYRVVGSRIFMHAWNKNLGKTPTGAHVLEELIKRYPLPDVDFIYFEDDAPSALPLCDSEGNVPLGPILASAKASHHTSIIRYHDWISLNRGWKGRMDGWDMYLWPHIVEEEIEPAISLYPWEARTAKLFWRGRATGPLSEDDFLENPRIKLLYLSQEIPDLFDTALTGWWIHSFLENSSEEMWLPYAKPPIEPPTRVQDHLQYKYQFVSDGNTSTFPGFAWRLLSNSLTFKVESPLKQWFEGGLAPGEHYISVKSDFSDLIEKLLWARSHDEEARSIAERARHFMLTQAMEEDALRYCYKVLLYYASLQRFQPAVPDPEKEPEFIFVSAPLEEV